MKMLLQDQAGTAAIRPYLHWWVTPEIDLCPALLFLIPTPPPPPLSCISRARITYKLSLLFLYTSSTSLDCMHMDAHASAALAEYPGR